jgi:hypothetical protein
MLEKKKDEVVWAGLLWLKTRPLDSIKYWEILV